MSEAPIVHGLHYGLPLCRFSIDPPATWPPGHKWAGIDEEGREQITCATCRALLKGQ